MCEPLAVCWMGQGRPCSAHRGFVSLGAATQVLSEHNWDTQLGADWLDWLLQPLPFLGLPGFGSVEPKGLRGSGDPALLLPGTGVPAHSDTVLGSGGASAWHWMLLMLNVQVKALQERLQFTRGRWMVSRAGGCSLESCSPSSFSLPLLSGDCLCPGQLFLGCCSLSAFPRGC